MRLCPFLLVLDAASGSPVAAALFHLARLSFSCRVKGDHGLEINEHESV